MKLSVLMPVYNEADTLREIVARVLAAPVDLELIIYDDGSTDGSPRILKEIDDPRVRVVSGWPNRGKGWAVRQALEYATGEAVIIQDADLEYDPQDYVKLLAVLEKGEARVVYGNRLHPGNERTSYLRYLVGGMTVSFFTNLLYGSRIGDEPTCYKLFDARLIKSLNLRHKRFGFCPEVTAKALRLGYSIVDVPIRYSPRSFRQGKKIKWKDGIHALWTLLKIRFQSRRKLVKPGAELPGMDLTTDYRRRTTD